MIQLHRSIHKYKLLFYKNHKSIQSFSTNNNKDIKNKSNVEPDYRYVPDYKILFKRTPKKYSQVSKDGYRFNWKLIHEDTIDEFKDTEEEKKWWIDGIKNEEIIKKKKLFPAGVEPNRYQHITNKNFHLARQRILDEYRKRQYSLHDPFNFAHLPDPGVLEYGDYVSNEPDGIIIKKSKKDPLAKDFDLNVPKKIGNNTFEYKDQNDNENYEQNDDMDELDDDMEDDIIDNLNSNIKLKNKLNVQIKDTPISNHQMRGQGKNLLLNNTSEDYYKNYNKNDDEDLNDEKDMNMNKNSNYDHNDEEDYDKEYDDESDEYANDDYADSNKYTDFSKFNEKGLLRQIVGIDKVQKVTKQGNTLNFRAIIIVGNTNGCAGYGIGRGPSVRDAISRGTRKALESFVYIDRFNERTFYHEITGKFNGTKVVMRPGKPMRGLTTGDTVRTILFCLGIKDGSAKCIGNRNPFSVIKATFNALKNHRTAEEIALFTGRSVFELNKYAKAQKL